MYLSWKMLFFQDIFSRLNISKQNILQIWNLHTIWDFLNWYLYLKEMPILILKMNRLAVIIWAVTFWGCWMFLWDLLLLKMLHFRWCILNLTDWFVSSQMHCHYQLVCDRVVFFRRLDCWRIHGRDHLQKQ